MRMDIMKKIQDDKDLLVYLRHEPKWYRLLGRNPYDYSTFERGSLNFHKKTIPHHVERVNGGLQMASLLLSMLQSQSPSPNSSEENISPEESPQNHQ
ncbi:hypothetical protein JOC78_000166 [Bacillus ectoiniformans]|uniref:YlbE-like family protein n=1 Tax=Bacillus ectoiniformans TaxID=1494429 RepID=UPI001957CDED|nr:YlbE-like family protein [Bacillus ectoiniformans]MBM7647245.1 hypothetical protein [Bacillus ectoiniformans]